MDYQLGKQELGKQELSLLPVIQSKYNIPIIEVVHICQFDAHFQITMHAHGPTNRAARANHTRRSNEKRLQPDRANFERSRIAPPQHRERAR